jgi:hypothetical protein
MEATIRMRGPSTKVRKNTVDIYVANTLPQGDTIGAPVWSYPPIPTYAHVRCTAQALGLKEVVDEQERVTQVVEWLLMFSINQPVSPRDMVLYKDTADGLHTIFIETSKDNAGRGGQFTWMGQEKV